MFAKHNIRNIEKLVQKDRFMSALGARSVRISMMAAAALGLSVFAMKGHAHDVGDFGGQGGGVFRISCEPGDFLVGFDVMATHVIDRIAPVCGYRNKAGTYGRPWIGGAAGTLHKPRCAPGAILTILHVFADKTPLVNRLGFTCWHPRTNAMTNSLPNYGGQPGNNQRLVCPVGEIGTGIYGRAGTAIDRLGLICEKWQAAPATTPVATNLTPEQQAILNAHNADRAKHCVPALSWSAQAAAAAQQWANRCTSNGRGGFAHDSNRGAFGENLAWGTSLGGQQAVGLWYGEISSYNFSAPTYSSAVGHFTQLVWRTTTQVGCAKATCGGQVLWACRYSPPGNMNVVVGPNVTAQQAQQSLMQNVPRTCH